MKTLLLVGCASMATAVLAPQFPQNFYAVGNTGECCCNNKELRTPYSVVGQTLTNVGPSVFMTNLGFAAADFVVTDIICTQDTRTACSSCPIESVMVKANGVAVCITGGARYIGGNAGGSETTNLQHGVVIPAGFQISVETFPYRGYVTLAGYLKN